MLLKELDIFSSLSIYPAKNLLSQKFIEFPINYFFLPNQSNSKKEVYKIYLGPIKGLAKATQWSKMINQESIILEY
jgi:hypothetical protein